MYSVRLGTHEFQERDIYQARGQPPEPPGTPVLLYISVNENLRKLLAFIEGGAPPS